MRKHAVTEQEKRLTLLGLMVVFLLGALDSTIVGTAMPRIIKELRGFELYAWVTTSYLLCSTVARTPCLLRSSAHTSASQFF